MIVFIRLSAFLPSQLQILFSQLLNLKLCFWPSRRLLLPCTYRLIIGCAIKSWSVRSFSDSNLSHQIYQAFLVSALAENLRSWNAFLKIIAYLFLCSTRVRHLVLRLCPKTKLTDVKFLVLQECVVATRARSDHLIYSNDLLGVTVSFDSYKIKVWCKQAAPSNFLLISWNHTEWVERKSLGTEKLHADQNWQVAVY